ncbi:hypothetical protein [Hafnia phage yong3]|nr:hypothetical protein [Hafnia phage yong3]
MKRKTLVLTREQYGDIIEPYMGRHITARNIAYSPSGQPTQEDYIAYVEARESMYEKRKEILQSYGVPCDSFVECIRSRDKQTFKLIWWEK